MCVSTIPVSRSRSSAGYDSMPCSTGKQACTTCRTATFSRCSPRSSSAWLSSLAERSATVLSKVAALKSVPEVLPLPSTCTIAAASKNNEARHKKAAYRASARKHCALSSTINCELIHFSTTMEFTTTLNASYDEGRYALRFKFHVWAPPPLKLHLVPPEVRAWQQPSSLSRPILLRTQRRRKLGMPGKPVPSPEVGSTYGY